jgi:L-lactate dehydrogenase complex protein LldF
VIQGPIGAILAPAVSLEAHSSLPFASTLCGSCADVCPVKIDIPAQLLAWRARTADAGKLPRGYSVIFPFLGRVLAKLGRYEMAARWARRFQRLLPASLIARVASPWTRPGRALPVIADETFREWARREGKRS